MGRFRRPEEPTFDLIVGQDAYSALLALAQEHETTPEEVLREQLLSDPDYRQRLVPRARQLLAHARIRLHVEEDGTSGQADE